jgi:bifunctional non-homologous end joining protein LigD
LLKRLNVKSLESCNSHFQSVICKVLFQGVESRVESLRFLKPMLLKPVRALPEGKEWLYELKMDGFRGMAIKEGSTIRFQSRKGNRLNFPILSICLSQIKAKSFFIDGEIVCLDPDGKPCFNSLQRRRGDFYFYAFDLLSLNGTDYRSKPLISRKKALKKLISGKNDRIRYCEHFTKGLTQIINFVHENNLEGIVAKRKSSLYVCGERSKDWIKFTTASAKLIVRKRIDH